MILTLNFKFITFVLLFNYMKKPKYIVCFNYMIRVPRVFLSLYG
jgi:hypothetical protein